MASRATASEQIERLAALDATAWQALYDEYFGKMRSFAYARTGDISLAEDIASEVFAAAVQRIGAYRQTGAPISAWLYRIARNLTADQVERQKRRPRLSLDEVEVEAPGMGLSFEERGDLLQALKLLTREQQEVLALRFFNDCTVEETAHAMGKNTGAIKVLQHRALGALRRHLSTGERRP
jgi:RNA polymerase sigma-70 factor (ECF subfamily)